MRCPRKIARLGLDRPFDIGDRPGDEVRTCLCVERRVRSEQHSLWTEEANDAPDAVLCAEHRGVDVEHPEVIDRLLLQPRQRLSEAAAGIELGKRGHSLHPAGEVRDETTSVVGNQLQVGMPVIDAREDQP